MTKVDLITGFLGVGKTTFMKRYADYLTAKGEKVHIIENELGGMSIDAAVLRQENWDVSQITGGCMCCTSRASFQSLLIHAAQEGFDRILVEPSGIYDVNDFFSVIATAPVNGFCRVNSIVTIVDSASDDLLTPEARTLMYSQLVYTGCVVMSKTQLHTPEEAEKAIQSLQELMHSHGSSRSIRELCMTKPWDTLTEEDFAFIADCGCHHDSYVSTGLDRMNHMNIFSTTMIAGRFDTLPHLEAILHDLVHTDKYGLIYRIKGFISDTAKNWYELNCSPSGCFVTKAHVRRGVFLVIGQNYSEEAVRSLFLPFR